jgi:hypothetical protein
MQTFVLVHGSHCGGWVWQKMTPLLRAGDHDVFAPTLTRLGDRSPLLNYGVILTTHIQDVASWLSSDDLQMGRGQADSLHPPSNDILS